MDDERAIRRLLRLYLTDAGFTVAEAPDGEAAIDQVRRGGIDLVLLDLMLPGMDGFEVCRRLEEISSVPVIMITARGDEAHRVTGLELGADDYVVKPFSPKEMLARVRAVLRRAHAPVSGAPLAVGGITLDGATHQATVAERPLTLTPKEFDLLRALLEARGRVLSREFLLDRVWGYARAGEIESRTVDVHVRRLRAKLGPEGERILTVKNVGYRLDPDG